MTDQAAGQRLRHYLREGMASADIDTLSELARRSGVGRDTLQAWMRGERPPTAVTGAKVAQTIQSSYTEMMRVWEGADEDYDPEAVVAALEWAIRLVRTGQVPLDVQREVEAAKRSASRQRSQRRAHSGG
jgi:transcriptional regulator with XRE-family HTH domain